MNVLVTGGAGYIGSVIVEECIKAGLKPVVIDSLEKGHRDAVPGCVPFIHADIGDRETLRATFGTFGIRAVVHLAAYSLVGESVSEPEKYYRNNVHKGTVLLDEMVNAHVNKIVFSSTAAVYGEPAKQPIEEGDSLMPTNPYGETKLAFERLLQTYSRDAGLQHVALRYFNAAGASENSGERHEPETHLIPIALQAAAGLRDAVEIYGDDYPTPDGTCIRDYIHVIDLARAHVLALKAESPGTVYNLGCGGHGYSVKQVIQTAEKVTGQRIKTKLAPRRNGDPPTLIASSELVRKELGWKPEHQDLSQMIESAWSWMQAHKSIDSIDRVHTQSSS